MENPHVTDAPGDGDRSSGAVERSAGLTAAGPARATRPAGGRRRLPPWPIWLLVALCAVAGLYLCTSPKYDSADRNVGTTLMCSIAGFALLIWFALASGYSRRLRWTLLAVVAVGGVLAAATLRIEQFNGSLVPSFRPRWQAAADAGLPAARAAGDQPPADLTATTAHDFAQFRGPHRDGVVPGVELARDWRKQPPERVWRHPIGAGWSAFACVGDFAVTLEQRGPEELVTCYRIDNGELVWAQATLTRHESLLGGVGPRSTPTIHRGKVYTLGATGRLHCLDGKDGRVVWEKNLLDELGIADPAADMVNLPWGRAGSPLVVNDLVVVPAGGPTGGPLVSLVAYDLDSGHEVWRGGERQISYASPALLNLLGHPTIVIVNESSITGHDPASGNVLWEESWPGSSNASASTSQCIAIDDHRLLVSKGYSAGAKLFEVLVAGDSEPRAWSTKEVWAKPRNLQTKFTNVVLHDDSIYGLSDGVLECVAQETGERRWKRREGSYGHGQILLVGDTILVLGEQGELALVAADPKQFEQLGLIEALDGKTWNNLALSTPHLLVRNGQEAACYRLALANDAAPNRAAVDPRPASDDNSRSPAEPPEPAGK